MVQESLSALSLILSVNKIAEQQSNSVVLAAAIPLNKQLYSISYVCLTAGAAGIVFSAFYALVMHHHLFLFNAFYKLLQLSMPTTNIFFEFFVHCQRADRYLGSKNAVLVPGVDWDECNAGVCNGSTGHLPCFCEWMVLRKSRQFPSKYIYYTLTIHEHLFKSITNLTIYNIFCRFTGFKSMYLWMCGTLKEQGPYSTLFLQRYSSGE